MLQHFAQSVGGIDLTGQPFIIVLLVIAAAGLITVIIVLWRALAVANKSKDTVQEARIAEGQAAAEKIAQLTEQVAKLAEGGHDILTELIGSKRRR